MKNRQFVLGYMYKLSDISRHSLLIYGLYGRELKGDLSCFRLSPKTEWAREVITRYERDKPTGKKANRTDNRMGD